MKETKIAEAGHCLISRKMKQDNSPTTAAAAAAAAAVGSSNKPSSVCASLSATPSRLLRASAAAAASSKSKDSLSKSQLVNLNVNGGISLSPSTKTRAKSVPPRQDYINNNNGTHKTTSLLLNKPKSPLPHSHREGGTGSRDLHGVKAVRNPPQPLVRQRLTHPKSAKGRSQQHDHLDLDLDGDKKKVLQDQRLSPNETLVTNLQAQVSQLKAELDKAHTLNLELLSHNTKLSHDLAAAEAKIAALTTHPQMKRESVEEYQRAKFKDIQKLIANKLEHPKVTWEAINETSATKVSSTAVTYTLPNMAGAQRKTPECPSTLPPPPPPPPPPRPIARVATAGKSSAVVELYWSLAKHSENKDPQVQRNGNKLIVPSAHNSIVGEIQNRSAHLLAINSDIETKGEFINGLIQKVLAASYTNIEDVLMFVDWLDSQLSSLADERAVLRHFKWPEMKADTLREAAIEYHGLKLLECEVSSFQDDANIPYGVALKKMAALLDKSERSVQKLIKLRNSVMLSYRDYKIPIDWMLDSGIVSKIKQGSIALAKMYINRVKVELELIRYSERESTQEALLLQGVNFAYRTHQFAGGLDSETLCAFEEIRQHVPGDLRRSQELLGGIPSSQENN